MFLRLIRACLSATNFDLNYFWAGRIERSKTFLRTSLPNCYVSKKNSWQRVGRAGADGQINGKSCFIDGKDVRSLCSIAHRFPSLCY